MNNLFFLISYLLLWTVVLAQGFIIFTFTKEINGFTSKIVGIKTSEKKGD